MTLPELVAVYLLVGLALAIRVLRKNADRGTRVWLSAGATVLLWPLWAPFA